MMVNAEPRLASGPLPGAGVVPRAERPAAADSAPAPGLDRWATLAALLFAGLHLAWTEFAFGGPTLTRLVLRGSLPLAAAVTTLACLAAARRSVDGARRGWRLLGLTAACWAVSQLLGSPGTIVTGRLPTFPAAGHALAGAAVVLSILALLAFLGDTLSSAARMRSLLDALLVAGGGLFLAWGLVFESLYRAAGDSPVRLLSLAYPVADLVVAVLIFVVARRAGGPRRLPWVLLGAAWGLFTAGHWSFAYLQLAGLERAPWVESTSWLGGFLLVALAAGTFRGGTPPPSDAYRSGGKLGIFVPYVPILLAAGAAGAWRVDWGAPAFLAVNGAGVIMLLLARQLVFQLENHEHARILAARVQRHTADLVRQEQHFRSIAQNASDVLTVVDSSGVIRYQSTSITRVLGLSAPDLVGHPLVELLAPAERRSIMPLIAAAAPPPAAPTVITTWLRHADGSSRRTEITVSNLLGDPAVRGFVLSTRDIGERLALEAQLREQAMQDPLTGLGNRMLFHDRLEHALARAQRAPEFLAVLMVDLDGFKQVNDSLGHSAGDRLLAEVARRLADCVRSGDTVCRMGGDEFAVLLERTELEGAAILAQRIVFRLRAPVEIDGRSIVAQGSVGVALGSTSTVSAEELLRNADLAMYAAKAKGKGAYEVFERDMHAAALGRMELESELREALRLRELTLYYQPVVEIPSGRISGAEALVRWNHPQRGMVSPAEFIPLAEQSGLVVDLGRWVLGEACRQAKRFQDTYPTDPPFTVAVNVSARQLTSPWLVDEVRKALAESHLPASSLVLEITEGALMSDVSTIIPALHELRAVGVRLAIDDFGTGWSSLSRLRSFPVDKLKIDQSFVAEITSSGDDAPIVAAIVAMAHGLRLTTVAEGVETIEQLACLHQRGCEEAQGYLLARPMPGDRLLALLAEPGGLLQPASLLGQPAADGPGLSRSEEALVGLVAETSRPDDGSDRIRPVLFELQRVTGAAAVFLTQVHWGELDQEVRFSTDSEILAEGTRTPWAGSASCEMLRDGSHFAADLAVDPPGDDPVRAFGATTLAAVPIPTADGSVFGMLCAAGRADGQLDPTSAVLLELFARLLVEHVTGCGAPAAGATAEDGRPERLHPSMAF